MLVQPFSFGLWKVGRLKPTILRKHWKENRQAAESLGGANDPESWADSCCREPQIL